MFKKTIKKKLWIFLVAFLISGCGGDLDKAREYSKDSQDFYQKAINEYKSVIKKSKDKDSIRFNLAKLYFQHKDYAQAVEELKQLDSEEAKKLLAISLFKSADYTSALEVFERLGEAQDGEYLFYYASTCEELNLYEPAVKLYEKIQGKEYKNKAETRLNAINLIDKGELAHDILDVISNSPGQEDFPQAGAVILLAEEDVQINSDNTAVYTNHFIVKILNERGKQDFSEIVIGYDSTYEKVELEFARTIKPDGTFITVGDKNIRDVSKYLNFPLYSNARAFIVSMPEVTNDCFIEYRVKVYRSRLIDKKHFILNYLLQINEPISKATFNVILPKGRKLRMNVLNKEFNDFNALLQPKIKTSKENVIYSWEFENIPQVIPEPSMPALSEITSVIQLSTFDSWRQINDWWWGLTEDKIKINDAIREKIKEITGNDKTPLEKAQSIANFCAQDIRYVAVEYGQAGFEPHRAEEVFQNKYGDCKDQAVLLIAMLREIGMKAHPVLIGTQGRIILDEEFPTLIFNHAIAVLEYEGKFIFLDPTAETTSFFDLPTSDQDRKVLIVGADGPIIEKIPLFKPSHNKVWYQTVINIDNNDSIEVERTVSSFGGYDAGQRYYFRYTMPIIVEENLKQKVQSICPGGILGEHVYKNAKDINKPIELYYKFSGDDFLAKAGRLRVLPQLGSIGLGTVVKDKRKYKIDFHRLEEIQTEIVFQLPDNFRVKYLPPSLTYKMPWLDFINDYRLEKDKIIFSEIKRFKVRYVDADEYLEFKEFLEKLAKKLNQRVILEQK